MCGYWLGIHPATYELQLVEVGEFSPLSVKNKNKDKLDVEIPVCNKKGDVNEDDIYAPR